MNSTHNIKNSRVQEKRTEAVHRAPTKGLHGKREVVPKQLLLIYCGEMQRTYSKPDYYKN